ncbi:Uncharacterised protein [Bordetella avium]|nr:Uncharacterised protein [Bordetella avium]
MQTNQLDMEILGLEFLEVDMKRLLEVVSDAVPRHCRGGGEW